MTPLRTALYVRVSTEEQSKHGLSVQAQLYTLEKWISEHGHIDAGHFADEGISGGKPIEKRPAMYRLLQAVQADQIDLIIFTKLDRWSRSLPNYYKAQEILEKHHCAWQAVEEDYETVTAAGTFKTNIMLSVAQQERQRTSERIKSVLDYKKALGKYVSGGHGTPWGYRVQNRETLIKDPDTEDACAFFWKLIISGELIGRAGRLTNEKFGLVRSYQGYKNITVNPIYKGYYNGQPGFCEPYIDAKTFDRLQIQHTGKMPPSGRVYLFSGLLHCPVCGNLLAANTTQYKDYYIVGYRCHRKYMRYCTFAKQLNENKLEEQLIEMVLPKDNRLIIDNATTKQSVKSSGPSPATIQAKMKRLAETYTDGLISREAYKSQLDELKTQMVTAQNAHTGPSSLPLEQIKEKYQKPLREAYNAFNREQKRKFWHMIIKSIHILENGNLLIDFL